MKIHSKAQKYKGKGFFEKDRWERIEINSPNDKIWKSILKEVLVYTGIGDHFVVQVRECNCNWGEVTHLVIKKIARESMIEDELLKSSEPTYQDKLKIKEVSGNLLCDAIEIMPKETEVIDGADLYHLWVLQERYKLPFEISYPKELDKEKSYPGYAIRYGVKKIESQYGIVECYTIHQENGEALCWRQKQEIKNTLSAAERTAIEVIPKDTIYMERDCHMIVLPDGFEIPFGINIRDWD